MGADDDRVGVSQQGVESDDLATSRPGHCGGDCHGRITTRCGDQNPAAAGGEPTTRTASGSLEPYIALMMGRVYTQALWRAMKLFLAPLLLTSSDPHL